MFETLLKLFNAPAKARASAKSSAQRGQGESQAIKALEDEQLFELALRLKAFSMEPVIVFALEASKPISFIVSEAMFAFEPLVGVFLDTGPYRQVAYLLADRKRIEELLKLLEGGEDHADRVYSEKHRAD